MCNIPAEIIDQIIDHLHDDKVTLSRCSLVCREWRSTTSFHLFSTLVLDRDRHADNIKDLRKTLGPILLSFVRELFIISWHSLQGIQWLNQALPKLPRFPSLKALKLSCLDWGQLTVQAKGFIFGLAPQLTVLHMNPIRIVELQQVRNVILAAPLLRHLVFNVDRQSYWNPSETSAVSGYAPPPISTIYIHMHWSTPIDFIPWIFTSNCTILDICVVGSHWLSRSAHILGSSLRHLKITFRGVWSKLFSFKTKPRAFVIIVRVNRH